MYKDLKSACLNRSISIFGHYIFQPLLTFVASECEAPASSNTAAVSTWPSLAEMWMGV